MKNKGLYNNENKELAEKVKNFFKESGFYIMVVVGLCILAVGAVYFTTNHLISVPDEFKDGLIPNGALATEGGSKEIVLLDGKIEPADDLAFEGQDMYDTPFDYAEKDDSLVDLSSKVGIGDTVDLDSSELDVETNIKQTASPAKAALQTKGPDKPENKGEQSLEVIKLFEKTPEFVMPVEGKIIMDYAMDRLLYSKTLDEWRTHQGIDIAAPRGDAVKAAGAGYIKEIKEDPCYGITITIDHENGYKTIYSNLASDSMVSVNQKVKAGDAISSVGNTAIFECMDPPHLHFEVYKNDKLINPKTVLPKGLE